MRDRPFVSGSESPRLYSDIRAERELTDPRLRLKQQVLADVAALESEAAEATTIEERNRLQCKAEALRCALAEQPETRR
jgi:hypothetical protein